VLVKDLKKSSSMDNGSCEVAPVKVKKIVDEGSLRIETPAEYRLSLRGRQGFLRARKDCWSGSKHGEQTKGEKKTRGRFRGEWVHAGPGGARKRQQHEKEDGALQSESVFR